MRILALGDVVGGDAVKHLQKELWDFRKREKIDFVVANGENTSDIRGISAADAERLTDAGVDLITLGNHAFGNTSVFDRLEQGKEIIRPANYPAEAPGNGYTVFAADGWRILCINVCGRIFMEPLASPFETVDRILDREAGAYDFAVMDIHAESTSEKLALAHYFDGRVAVMFGTHTHVPTADLQILPGGSGYITDLGMCGVKDSIIGSDTETVLRRFLIQIPSRMTVAKGEVRAEGAVFDVEDSHVKRAKRVWF